MNLRQLLERQSEKDPDKTFLYFGDQEVSYGNFDASVNRAANVFLDLGIKKGDRVCFFLPNCPEFLYGWFGLAKIGAVLVPINTNYKTEETRYILHHSEANTLLVHASLKQVVERVQLETPSLKNFLSLGEGKENDGYLPFGEALRNASDESPAHRYRRRRSLRNHVYLRYNRSLQGCHDDAQILDHQWLRL